MNINLILPFAMREPKTLYDLRYYARGLGYIFSKKGRTVTVTEGRRSAPSGVEIKVVWLCDSTKFVEL